MGRYIDADVLVDAIMSQPPEYHYPSWYAGLVDDQPTVGWGDTPHEVTKIRDGELHRFRNPAGVDYSAIYRDGYEVWSCTRDHEDKMLEAWNESLMAG